MKPSLALLKSPSQTSSSSSWLARQFSDPYVKKRLSEPSRFRSRSAFKLMEMNDKYHFIPKVYNSLGEEIWHGTTKTVIDLGAAPGGWSQVVSAKMGLKPSHLEMVQEKQMNEGDGYGLQDSFSRTEGGWSTSTDDTIPQPLTHSVIALDILRIQPIPGVQTLQLSFLDPLAEEILAGHIPNIKGSATHLRPKVDLILSDMAPNMSGNKIADIEGSMELCEKVFGFACRYLKPHQAGRGHGQELGGNLVMKHFTSPEAHTFRMAKLATAFKSVYYVKPDASRRESSEGYWVCKNFQGLQ